MKIGFAPNSCGFHDNSILQKLAEAFRKKGHECFVFRSPLSPNSFIHEKKKFMRPKPDLVQQICKLDVLLQINRERPFWLHKNCFHISWHQDVYPKKKIYENNKKNNLTYYLRSPNESSKSKIKFLFPGFDDAKKVYNNEIRSIDINLIGYLSPIFELIECKKKESTICRIFLEIIRKPRTVLNIFQNKNLENVNKYFKTKAFQEALDWCIKNYIPLTGKVPEIEKIKKGYFKKEIYNYVLTEYPRFIDRKILFEKLEELSPKWQCFVGGPNWKKYSPVSKIIIQELVQEKTIFGNSKITLHNNCHGVGIHQRVMTAIAEGSFVMMHGSPDGPENLASVLDPNLHFGIYTKLNFSDRVEFWLKNKKLRLKGLEEAKKILQNYHSWEKRAEQILDDLNKLM